MGLLDFLGTGATFKNGQVDQKGTGILGWIGENPALFTGYATAALGSNQGMSGLESLSLGAQAAGGVQRNVQQAQQQAAQNAALQTQATLEQQKLLLDISKAQQETRQGDIKTALEAKAAEQAVINESYDTASKMFPKDPKAAADYAQKLIMQKTKGGQVNVGNKSFLGILGSRPITYTPNQQSGVAGTQRGASGAY